MCRRAGLAVVGKRGIRVIGRLLRYTVPGGLKSLGPFWTLARFASPTVAHSTIGAYLATEFVSQIIGLETYDIPHVQGHTTTGHRLRHECQTVIVPILRGGEPMTFGVAKVFPSAMFVHAKEATDLEAHHVQGCTNIILVDSVVNSGKTVIEFMDRLKDIDCKAEHVVFVTGVAQSGAVDQKNGPLVQIKDAGLGKLSIVALRVSVNKFKGERTTDTGNRLFNTTHLD